MPIGRKEGGDGKMAEIPNIGDEISKGIKEGFKEQRKARSGFKKFFGGEDGGISINIDFGKVMLGFISLSLAIAAFMIYLIPYVLVLSIPMALAALVCGLIPVFSFGSSNWFRGFVPGLVGAAISGVVLGFNIYYLITPRVGSFLGGFWF